MIDFDSRKSIFLIGIKGTGMSTLAIRLQAMGHEVSGSDIPETFYTDEILARYGIPIRETFSADNITESCDLIIYSTAYDENLPEFNQARKFNIPTMTYAQYLGHASQVLPSICIAGVHGKSTVTSLTMHMAEAMGTEAFGVAGAFSIAELSENTKAGASYKKTSNAYKIPDIGIFEACEYQRNFLCFTPRVLVITAIESDHNDYFPDHAAIEKAFQDVVQQVQDGGRILLCADDDGCIGLAKHLNKSELLTRNIGVSWYGTRKACEAIATTKDEDCYVISDEHTDQQETVGSVHMRNQEEQTIPFVLRVCGGKLPLNVLAAYASLQELHRATHGSDYSFQKKEEILQSVSMYRGIKRRTEIYGNPGGILIIDDYAHHPTAIRATLRAIRTFYTPRRIVVDFASHTYTRTHALLDEFARAFEDADVVVVNDIYASAREKKGSITGKELARAISEYNSIVCYKPDFQEAALSALSFLKSGDAFVSLGAGQSWQVAKNITALLMG